MSGEEIQSHSDSHNEHQYQPQPQPQRINVVIEQPQRNYNISPITREDLEIIRSSKTIKLFSLIDIIFIFLTGIFYPILFLFILFPLAGWYGAKLFKWYLLIVYAIYLFAEVIFRLYNYTNALTIISGLVSILIFGYVVKFIKNIWNKSETEKDLLIVWGQKPELKMCGAI